MSPMGSFLVFFSLLTILSNARQDRAPHGIVYENPIAFTPSAYDFFHPSTRKSCETSNCSPLPVAAQVVQASPGHESRELASQKGSRVGAGAIAGIAFGLVFAVLLGMGVYYVVITRRDNTSRTNSVQPDA
ncbi:hypothetical protein FH972_011317 [Carpinus fangiana]|uniref:Transmembrane protein n=1 Tax=Carpinus fangiana TaxID=176857 RepID=A0A660KU11_9ROSI|nr:hypothetical protein FH972_011317 [Carpinus fangiana]